MSAALLVLAATLLGNGVVRRLAVETTRLERITLAGAIAFTLGPWLAFLAAWPLGFRLGIPLAIAIMTGVGVALRRRAAAPPLVIAPTSALSWAALLLLAAALFHGHMFHVEPDGLYTAGSSYGDLALHATLTNHFAANGVSLQSPIVAGAPLTYPFLGDLAIACLVRGGWSLSFAMTTTGIAMLLLALGVIQAIALRLFQRRAAATLAVWLIMLSGSAAGIVLALSDAADFGLPAHLADLPNYSHLRERGLVFANFACDFFLPQRAFLAAMPAFFTGLWLVVVGVRTAPRLLRAAGAAFGLLPLLHIHSFLVALAIFAWLALWHLRGRDALRIWLPPLALMLGLAAPQLAWQFGQSWTTHFGQWQLGWIAPSGEWWSFWLRQWGLALISIPLLLYFAARRDRRVLLPLTIAALLLFAASNLYRFQPHDWDNMKFLVYAYMLLCLPLAGALSHALSRGPCLRIIATLSIIALTATGAISIARELQQHQRLASTDDLALADAVARAVPADARVLTTDAHNHLVPMLAGRAIAMGYRGWLWTHGIDDRALARDVARMFVLDASAPQLFARYHITHVYIGPGERRTYHAALAAYRKQYPRVLERGDVEVFDVRAPSRGSRSSSFDVMTRNGATPGTRG